MPILGDRDHVGRAKLSIVVIHAFQVARLGSRIADSSSPRSKRSAALSSNGVGTAAVAPADRRRGWCWRRVWGPVACVNNEALVWNYGRQADLQWQQLGGLTG